MKQGVNDNRLNLGGSVPEEMAGHCKGGRREMLKGVFHLWLSEWLVSF